jgi:fused signal recognition particle receptor
MGRWFRRQDKDRKKARQESPAPPPEEVPVSEPVRAGSPRPCEETPPREFQPEEAAESARPIAFPEKIPPEISEAVGTGLPCPDPEVPPESIAPDIETVEKEAAEAAEPRRGRFRRLRERLGRTRETLAGGLDRLLRGRKEVDAALLEELEELLITADLGVDTTLFLIGALQEKLRRRELADVERLKAALKAEMVALLASPPPPMISARPWVVLVVGINGVGKTTTIAKLAHQARLQGLSPMLVAADTFRAAAVEQLEIWGERVGAPVVKQKTGADPAAVVFDGLAAAQARGADLVYVDTAGRLHTKVNLMGELKKIQRTAAKRLPGAPHETFLVLDATTGQNALSQARLFHEAVGLTGLILTKMDGTAKGGVALGVVHETGIPLRYIGVGEDLEDLRPFDAEAFVEAILG